MNLNFYDPSNTNALQSLQTTLNDSLTKLDSLRNSLSTPQPQQQQQQVQTNQPSRYYLDCGNKQDWTQFLRLNYGITEEQIFEDYKLFLQAKAEIAEDNNKEKLQAMKQKLSSVNGNKGKQKNVNNYATNANNNDSTTVNINKLPKDINSNETKGNKYVR